MPKKRIQITNIEGIPGIEWVFVELDQQSNVRIIVPTRVLDSSYGISSLSRSIFLINSYMLNSPPPGYIPPNDPIIIECWFNAHGQTMLHPLGNELEFWLDAQGFAAYSSDEHAAALLRGLTNLNYVYLQIPNYSQHDLKNIIINNIQNNRIVLFHVSIVAMRNGQQVFNNNRYTLLTYGLETATDSFFDGGGWSGHTDPSLIPYNITEFRVIDPFNHNARLIKIPEQGILSGGLVRFTQGEGADAIQFEIQLHGVTLVI